MGDLGKSISDIETTPPDQMATAHSFFSSFDDFAQPWFVVSLFIGLALSVACATALAMHPRRASRGDPVADVEQRRTLILLALIGAVVAELVRVKPVMALVIFGIGGLIRFRTLLGAARITAKAILVVVVGLAAGLGEYAMACFVTLFAWVITMWVDGHVGASVRIRLQGTGNLRDLLASGNAALRHLGCRVVAAEHMEHKRQVIFQARVPVRLSSHGLEAAIRDAMPQALGPVEVRVRTD